MNMSALDHIKWSVTDYDMKDFVELFSYNLPILCQTTTGYAGCDEDIHQIGANEIYWIYEILRQQRIVARDSEGRYISIPVDKCSYNFQIVDEDNKRCAMVTPANLQDNLRENKPRKVRFMFEKDGAVSYQIGADTGSATKFGVMTLEESYEEKYLLGFGMHSGVLFCRTVGIPVYMDISFSRAVGFDEDEKGGRRFRGWTEDLKALVDSTEKTSIRTCQAIIVFMERPSNGDYEYIRPNNFLVDSLIKPNKNIPSNKLINTSNEYSYTISRELNKATQLQEPVDRVNESQALTDRTSDHHMEILTVKLPPMPRRRPPTPPPAITGSAEGMTSEKGAKRTPPAIPSRKNKPEFSHDCPRLRGDEVQLEIQTPEITAQTTNNSDDDDYYEDVALSSAELQWNNKLIPFQTDSTDSIVKVGSEHLNNCTDESNATRLASSSFSNENVSNAVAAVHASRLAIYDSAAQVPCDEDIETWTVGDVADLLRLLKMNQYSDVFRQNEIDGALLLSLDEKTLVGDFGFKQFEATKVVMFIRKGWRPK